MLRMLMDFAEAGYLPDSLIRAGVRRLLKSRLRELHELRQQRTIEDFLLTTRHHPIAVVPHIANDQHYELPPLFFETVLGKHLKYSSCYWEEGTECLDAAEEAALRITCENAGIEDGMDILELGCGWGSLSLWMAERYPKSRITSVSNSASQRQYIEGRTGALGLHNLKVVTADMNNFATSRTFDRIVSVEMFEHMRNHRELMNKVHDWLRPQGRLFVHMFCHKDTPYLFETQGTQNWMGQHFFTGGMMPTPDLLSRCGSSLMLVKQSEWDGSHYAKTSRAWLNRHDANKNFVMNEFTNTYGARTAHLWFQRWRLFFIACEELFAFNGGNEWFVTHSLFERQ